jgi:exonuclease VII large subunit
MIDLRAALQNYRTRLVTATLKLLAERNNALSSLGSQLRYASPERRIQSERQRVDELTRRVHSSLFHHMQLESAHIRGMQRRLEALNPMAVLGRGYAVVTRSDDGSVISRLAHVSDEMNVRVSDGEFEVRKSEPRTS